VNCAGCVPFAMMASRDNRVGYEMEIITYPGRGIEKVEGIRGKKMAFTFETSNSGYEAPSALLRDQFKMEAGKDYKPVFSSAWRRIGMLFEEFALVERSTLMENLLSGRLGYTGFWASLLRRFGPRLRTARARGSGRHGEQAYRRAVRRAANSSPLPVERIRVPLRHRKS
jgi:hypothetical protein